MLNIYVGNILIKIKKNAYFFNINIYPIYIYIYIYIYKKNIYLNIYKKD